VSAGALIAVVVAEIAFTSRDGRWSFTTRATRPSEDEGDSCLYVRDISEYLREGAAC
jgi:hypothetical protein